MTGGTYSGEPKPSSPKFRFLLGFRPLYFGNIGKSKKMINVENFFFKIHDFWGNVPLEF